MDTPSSPTGARRAAPELVALVLGLVVWIVVGAGVLATSDRAGAADPLASGAVADASARPAASDAIDPSVVELLRAVHKRLDENLATLEAAIGAEDLDMVALPATVRQVNSSMSLAEDFATTVGTQPGGRAFSKALLAAYDPVLDTLKAILALSLTNEAGYRDGVRGLIRQLRALPDIDALLIKTSRTSGAASSPSLNASSSPTPRPSPTPSKAPATAEPTEAPTGTPASTASGQVPSGVPTTNVLTNPGFEAGSEGWTFAVAPGATAAFDVTDEQPHGGAKVGRVTVASGAGGSAAAVLRQDGLALSNGQQYGMTLWARAASTRDLRVRVTNELGQVLLSRTFSVGPTWQPFSATLITIGEVRDGSLLIETGGSDQPVWLDDVSFG